MAEAMACLLLQRVLGTGPGVKYGGCQGVLGQVATATGGNVAASGQREDNIWYLGSDYHVDTEEIKLRLL